MKKMPLKELSLIFAIIMWVGSCRLKYTYRVPEQTDDGWQTANLEKVRINGRILGKAIERIIDGTYKNIHSLLIVKDGKLVFEEYFSGYRFDNLSDQFRGDYTEFEKAIESCEGAFSITKWMYRFLL